jgi:hypothetical protein
MLPQKRHERRMVLGIDDTSVSLTRVVILFVRQDRRCTRSVASAC